MDFGIPQIIIITLNLAALLLAANQHGKPRVGVNNFWLTLVGTVANTIILYAGGFFS